MDDEDIEMVCNFCGRVRENIEEPFWTVKTYGQGKKIEIYCPVCLPESHRGAPHKQFLEEHPDGRQPKEEEKEEENWDYKCEKVKGFRTSSKEEYLRIMGALRWELVNIDKGIAYFKRRVK